MKAISPKPIRFALCDIGANLTDSMFNGIYRGKEKHRDDFEDMMIRAKNQGVNRIIVTGGSLSESKAALELVRKHDGLFCTVGCHPTRCSEAKEGEEEYFNELLKLAKDGMSDGKCVAIGECGLDYDRLEFCDKEQQKIGFIKHFKLAQETSLPLFLHNRNTGTDFVSMMKEYGKGIRGVVHSFTGESKELVELLSLGLYIGINGCSLKTEENLNVLHGIPLDRLLLETDAPWCGIKNTHSSSKYVKTKFEAVKKPEAFIDGKMIKDRCEPCMMIQVLEVVSAVLKKDEKEIAEQVHINTNNLFFETGDHEK